MSPARRLLLLALCAAGAGCHQAGPQANRLIAEKSPYLQQHAHNPVDWYPWGAEAFEKARREDKAIFLSIGYSTCHWCHVMEAESFSNPEIAAFMNQHFVSIKVDREERPDLDRQYMNYVIGVSEGGWPMSLVLMPDLRPFFGANYLPPDDRDGQVGFRTLLQRIATLWETRRSDALRAAADGTQALEARSALTRGAATAPDEAELDRTFEDLSASFDASAGGFCGAPKFPRPVVLNFLMRYYARTGSARALDMALETLRAMARGGIRDHLGGGFHRYAVDREWRLPHFEKMVYDQAQLAAALVDAYQASGDALFADLARETLDYVLRDMRDPEGRFYSAEGAAVLSERHSVEETAGRFGVSGRDVRARLAAARQILFHARGSRPRPARDDKVLVAWNGLMLSALAKASVVLDGPTYRDAAVAAARFLERRLYDPATETLVRRYRAGDAAVAALLEDYAFLIQGLLDLSETSFDPRWLAWALRLQAQQDRWFWDDREGGYFSTRADAADLLTRVKEEYDGAGPSANSVSTMNLLRLWQLTGQQRWRDRADATFRALSPRVARSGLALPQLLAALEFSRSHPTQIVIAGDRDAPDTRALLKVVHDRFIPNRILVLVEEGRQQELVAAQVPFVSGMGRRSGRATIYICENSVCRLPTADPAVAARLLDGARGHNQRSARL